jgi:hypothetical protein
MDINYASGFLGWWQGGTMQRQYKKAPENLIVVIV